MQQLESFLHNFIPGIQQEEINSFLELWNIRKEIKRNDFLSPLGKTDSNLYFILKGSFKITYEIDGEEMILGFGYPETLLVDFPSFVHEKPSDFHIQAIKSSQVVGISKSDFNSFIDKNQHLSQFWRNTLEKIALDLIEREIDLLSSSPQKRFDRLMQRSPNVFQHIANKHIASYLRMTPETLSRLKKR